jgi:ribonuclease PH
MRKDGRSSTQTRPIRFVPNYLSNPLANVLIEWGETIVSCSVNAERGVPGWLRNSRPAKGWLSAEYCMLPSSTHTRIKRERGFINGRSQEIQRLIGRSLRSALDLTKCPDISFVVDCDVLQADGGTRTASITGGWVALKMAVNRLLHDGRLRENPLVGTVAAVSVGYKNGNLFVDPDYSEDSTADLDMNVVMADSGKIQEIQGTGEQAGFDLEQLNTITTTSQEVLSTIFELQQAAVESPIET